MNTTRRRVTRLPCVRSGGRNDELDKTEDGLDGLDGEILDSRSGTTPTMNKEELRTMPRSAQDGIALSQTKFVN